VRPLVLGITGRVGAGKSSVCAELAARGWAVLDLDELVRTLLAERGLDRRAIFAEVLADPAAFARWREVLGPEVSRRVEGWIAALDGPGALEAAMLFELVLDRCCDQTLCLRCPVDERRRRVTARASPSASRFDAIEAAQWPEDRKADRADAELASGGSIDEALRRAERTVLRRAWLATGAAPEIFDQLCARYDEPHRAYHTLAHVAACLRELEDAPVDQGDAAALVLGVFYHDAIYDPLAPQVEGNEARSAALAEHDLGPVLGERVAGLVRATMEHRSTADPLSGYLVDVDLSILAARPRDFAAYERDIRAEYATVPWSIYAPRRRDVLKRFLERRPIYQTAWGRERYEAKALQNLRGAVGKAM
jgi:predicted metal-dependent HD superfamily phosphohydrolase/dephospho-CoA kinase